MTGIAGKIQGVDDTKCFSRKGMASAAFAVWSVSEDFGRSWSLMVHFPEIGGIGRFCPMSLLNIFVDLCSLKRVVGGNRRHWRFLSNEPFVPLSRGCDGTKYSRGMGMASAVFAGRAFLVI